MKKQKIWLILLAVFIFTGCAGCSVPEEEEDSSDLLTLMTWNVHNLFDEEDNGFEYDEFLQSSGWSAEKYLGRIYSISDAIRRIDPMPDIIMFQEIENIKTLKDLAAAMQSDYSCSHFAINPGAALGVGIISRYPITDIMAHSVTVHDDTSPRPVLETRIQAKEEIVIFTNHWKSKIGGDEETERVRRTSARVILRRIRELWENEPNLGIIIAGDLNLNHDEFYRQNSTMICALLPDDPYCAQISEGVQNDYIVISRNKPPVPVHFPEETICFFSPWIRELEKGTYLYKNNWETIDHFLLSYQFFGSTGWVYENTVIIDYPPFTNANGTPVPYNPRTGLGLSDHLPLVLQLRMEN